MKAVKGAFRRWSHALALAVVVALLSYRLHSLLSLCLLLPGEEAPFLYKSARDFAVGGVVSFDSLGGFQMASYAFRALTGSFDLAVKLAAVFTYALLTLASCAFVYSVTRSKWLGVLGALAMGLSPAALLTVGRGDFNALFAAALVLSALSAALAERVDRKRFLLLALASFLVPFSSTACSLGLLAGLAVLLARRFGRGAEAAKIVAPLSIGSAVSLLSLSRLGVAYGEWAWSVASLIEHFGGLVPACLVCVLVPLGGAAYYVKRRDWWPMAVAGLASLPLIAAGPEHAALAYGLALPFALYPVLMYGEAVAVRSVGEGEERVVEVEVSVEKAVAIFLVLATLLAAGGAGASSVESSVLRDAAVQPWIVDLAEWISLNTPPGSKVAAPPEVVGWLSVLTGRVPYEVDEEFLRSVDLVTSTFLRVETEFLRVDEWEPFSAARAPAVSVWDGLSFRGVVFVDDSKVRASLRVGEKPGVIESPYRARFLGYSVDRLREAVVVREAFETDHTVINKTLVVYTDRPAVEVRYLFSAKRGAVIETLQLPVWSSFGARVRNVTVGRGEAWMAIDGFDVYVRYIGSQPQVSGKLANHPHVNAVFRIEGYRAEIGLVVRVEGARRSGRGVWVSNILQESRKYGFNYVVTRNVKPLYLEQGMVARREALYVVDAFVRFLIESWGKEWVEAPSYALVLSDRREGNATGWVRFTTFRTAGLIVNKTTVFSQHRVEVEYVAAPHKERTYLERASVSVWIPWER
ncbi:MAG: hypothetical protein DRJ56_05265, partial [Thermoprotei archaeon]